MMREHAGLQRRAFLTPIWLTVFGALVGMSCVGFAAWMWGTADSTTIIVVRHAEKAQDGGADPPLTDAGELRAALLATMFGDADKPGHIDAIFVSPTVPNRMTAAPLAARLHVTPIVVAVQDARDLARRVMREYSGRRVLVVGRGDIVTGIVESLTGTAGLPPLHEDEYGTMYVVTVPKIGRPDFLRVSYQPN